MKIGNPYKFFVQLDAPVMEKFKGRFGSIAGFLGESDSFQFECNRCGRCCTNRFGSDQIILSSYDVLRLRRRLGITSTQFLQRYTELILGAESRLPIALLSYQETKSGRNRCPFLRSYGCSVYEDRPLLCRLYSVGRALDTKGVSYFFLTRVGSHCGLGKGEPYTVKEWLEKVDALPFLNWSNRFFQLITEIDHEKYKVIDTKVKFALSKLLYDFDSLLMLSPEKVKKLQNEDEIMSTILGVFKIFVKEIKGGKDECKGS